MKKIGDLRVLSVEQLQEELISLRKEQFKLRMSKASGSLDKTHRITSVRKTVARVKTLLTEKVGN